MSSEELIKDFGDKIRAARKAKGYSQEQLAQLASCSQRFVSEVERGKTTAEVGKVFALVQALGLTVRLVDGSGRESASNRRLSDYL